jgi:O-antigen/teichoic acid export membrane protein
MEAMAALLGASIAGSTHLTKAGTRVVVNTSREPFSNWALSVIEDGFVIALGFLALKYPLAAGVVAIAGLTLIVFFARWLFAAARRRWRTARPTSD